MYRIQNAAVFAHEKAVNRQAFQADRQPDILSLRNADAFALMEYGFVLRYFQESKGNAMSYKLMIFDFDGTLRPDSEIRVRRKVADALNAVQATGVKLAVATGRCRGALHPRLLRSIRPDYFICANGSQVEDRAGSRIYTDTLSSEEMYALVDWCEDYEYALAFAFSDGYYAYVEADKMQRFYRSVGGDTAGMVFDGEDQNRHLESMPFDAFCEITPEGVEKFQKKYGYLGLRFMPYNSTHYDVIPQRMGKACGINALLQRLQITAEETVAVGDGENDEDMLRLVGCGVAMGNAKDSLKAIADRECPDVQEDGVAVLCRELFPEAFSDG